MELVDFLLARIAEDEAVADRWPDALIERPGGGVMHDDHGHPIYAARSKVLAECEAKRGLVRDAGDVPTVSLRRALMWLALPYADHPDYDQTWRP